MADLFTRVDGRWFRLISERPQANPLETRFAAKSRTNRWNAFGVPTLYASSDPAVAGTEWLRHIDIAMRDDMLATGQVPKQLWAIDVDLDNIIDLTDEATRRSIGLTIPIVDVIDDLEACQELSERLRLQYDHQGLIVPAVAFPDSTTRKNLVIYADRVTDYPGKAVFARDTRYRIGFTMRESVQAQLAEISDWHF